MNYCPSCGYPGGNRAADSCRYCEGHEAEIWPDGRPDLPHPFVTLESAMEHLQTLRAALGIIAHSDKLPPPSVGSPAYSYAGVEDALNRLLQQLVILLPDEYARTEAANVLPRRSG